MTTEMVLVTGATGNTGRPLMELLCARGVPVRAMVRSAAGREQLAGLSAEVVVADFDDPEAVFVALAVSGAPTWSRRRRRERRVSRNGSSSWPRGRACPDRSANKAYSPRPSVTRE